MSRESRTRRYICVTPCTVSSTPCTGISSRSRPVEIMATFATLAATCEEVSAGDRGFIHRRSFVSSSRSRSRPVGIMATFATLAATCEEVSAGDRGFIHRRSFVSSSRSRSRPVGITATAAIRAATSCEEVSAGRSRRMGHALGLFFAVSDCCQVKCLLLKKTRPIGPSRVPCLPIMRFPAKEGG